MFILGLQCGIEGAYFTAAQGAPAYSGVFTAWCDLREITPYAFGYMMAAKVGTGIVAELGAMRISDEIDALEVMGINSVTFLCATRMLAAWLGAVGATVIGGVGTLLVVGIWVAMFPTLRRRQRLHIEAAVPDEPVADTL